MLKQFFYHLLCKIIWHSSEKTNLFHGKLI